MSEDQNDPNNAIELATELTVAWLSNPNTRATAQEVPEFLKSMHDAVASLSAPAATEPTAEEVPTHTPAVSVRKSLANPNHIISMIDGKPYKTLRRHLSTHGLTPAEYRERYGLKPDYPMVAPTYSEQRRAMAKKIGLGRKPGETRPTRTAKAASASRPRRTRRSSAAAQTA